MLESYTRLGRAWGVRGKANKGFTKVQMMSEFRDVHDKASNEWFSNRCLKELVEDQIFTRRGSNYLLNIKTGEGKVVNANIKHWHSGEMSDAETVTTEASTSSKSNKKGRGKPKAHKASPKRKLLKKSAPKRSRAKGNE